MAHSLDSPLPRLKGPATRHSPHSGWLCDIAAIARLLAPFLQHTLYSCVVRTPISGGHAANTKRLALAFASCQTCEEPQSCYHTSIEGSRCSAHRQITRTSREHSSSQYTETAPTPARPHSPEPVALVFDSPWRRSQLLVNSRQTRRQIRQSVVAEVENRHFHQSIHRTRAVCIYIEA